MHIGGAAAATTGNSEVFPVAVRPATATNCSSPLRQPGVSAGGDDDGAYRLLRWRSKCAPGLCTRLSGLDRRHLLMAHLQHLLRARHRRRGRTAMYQQQRQKGRTDWRDGGSKERLRDVDGRFSDVGDDDGAEVRSTDVLGPAALPIHVDDGCDGTTVETTNKSTSNSPSSSSCSFSASTEADTLNGAKKKRSSCSETPLLDEGGASKDLDRDSPSFPTMSQSLPLRPLPTSHAPTTSLTLPAGIVDASAPPLSCTKERKEENAAGKITEENFWQRCDLEGEKEQRGLRHLAPSPAEDGDSTPPHASYSRRPRRPPRQTLDRWNPRLLVAAAVIVWSSLGTWLLRLMLEKSRCWIGSHASSSSSSSSLSSPSPSFSSYSSSSITSPVDLDGGGGDDDDGGNGRGGPTGEPASVMMSTTSILMLLLLFSLPLSRSLRRKRQQRRPNAHRASDTSAGAAPSSPSSISTTTCQNALGSARRRSCKMLKALMIGCRRRGRNSNFNVCASLFVLSGLFIESYPAVVSAKMGGFSCEHPSTANMLSCLPPSYSKFDLPVMTGVMEIGIAIDIDEVLRINDKDYSITFSSYFNVRWWDRRIHLKPGFGREQAGPGINVTNNPNILVPINLEFVKDLWLPNIFIYNLKTYKVIDVLTKLAGLWIGADRSVLYSQATHITFICPMRFDKFPLDTQSCRFQVGSYSYDDSKMIFVTDSAGYLAPKTANSIALDYSIDIHRLKEEDQVFLGDASIGNFSLAGFEMILHRYVSTYIITYYLPSGLFVIVSWISFLIPMDVIPGRMALLVTLFLVLVNIFNTVTTNTPKAEGLTAIEAWMLACILFVFGALIE